MNRRSFLITSGIASLALEASPIEYLLNNDKIDTANDLNEYLRSLCKVKEPSVDKIIIGNPDTEISKIGTAWMPYFSTLKEAVSQGVNVLIVHEPTFYTHHDLENSNNDFYNAPEPARSEYLNMLKKKKRWIEENKLVIIRCHDVLDIIKDFGIPFGLGLSLGYKNDDIIESQNYYNVYKVKEKKASVIVKNIAQSLMKFNQPGVAFYGNPDRLVKSVGVGTGCICDPQNYAGLGADLHIAIDDVVRTWIHTTFAEDSGNPLVVINHGTSEEMGMRLLNTFLKKNIPNIPIAHFNQGCGYKWISG